MAVTDERSSLYRFFPATARNDARGAEFTTLFVIENHHVRPCSGLESRLYDLLRETTRTAMSPELKERIWAVIGESDD